MSMSGIREVRAPQSVPRCGHCDDTGDVHGFDGEWHGRCSCEFGSYPVRTIDDPRVPERIILSNARRICARRYQRLPNWSLAMEVFGLGSTWAWALCQRIGIDPDGRTMQEVNKARTLADATQNPPQERDRT